MKLGDDVSKSDKTALVTGANSGLGFEAAAQLADAGWGKIILACRSTEKAEAAQAKLVARTGTDPFAMLSIDTSEVSSANAAADELQERGEHIDFLLLNAGATRKDPTFSSSRVEITYASTLVGHHVLTIRALAGELLTPNARLVIAGSEGSCGNIPGMGVHDIAGTSESSFSGDITATIEAFCRLDIPVQTNPFKNMREYVTSKLFVAWWAAALARKLPGGMTVNAVSPGSALATDFGRNASTMMRFFMMPIMKLMGPLMGMDGSTESAAGRYVAAADYGDDQTGHFFATAHRRKVVRPVGIQTWPEYFLDEASQEACFDAMVKVTGVEYPTVARDKVTA